MIFRSAKVSDRSSIFSTLVCRDLRDHLDPLPCGGSMLCHEMLPQIKD